MNKNITRIVAIFGMGALAMYTSAVGAFAGTATANLTVGADVKSWGTIQTAQLAFGDYQIGQQTASDSQTPVSVTVSQNTPYSIDFGNGTYGNNTPTGRQAGDGSSHYLTYNIYSSVANRAAGTTVLGDNTNGTDHFTGTGNGLADTSHTVYGRVPANQVTVPNHYSDTVIMTLNF